MLSANSAGRISLIATLGLIVLAVFVASGSLWGLNHFKYNTPYTWYLLGVLIVVTFYLAFGPFPQARLERMVERISGVIWGKSVLPRILFSLSCTVLFIVFRVQTAFLGDGFFLLNTFGREETYTSHFIKPVSIWIIKLVQQAFGGYTYWTALYTFQTISIVSGFFVVYNFIVIAGMLTKSAGGRLLALGTLLFSGWILLFFGYIEYYPMLWLAASFFIRFSISFLNGKAPFWIVLLSFLVTISFHVEAIFYLPGVLYLGAFKLARRKLERMTPRTARTLMIVMIVAVPVVVLAAGQLLTSVQNPYLPLVSFQLRFPYYGVLSLNNLLEISNQILLCIPAILILLAPVFTGSRQKSDHTSRLLVLFSFGSLAYLFTVDPKLGLARDFDMMSLTLFAPLLMLLYRIGRHENLPLRTILISIVLSLVPTVSFLGANCSRSTSITRAHDLLRFYGAKQKQGWLSFANFLEADGQKELFNEVTTEINAAFPEEGKFATALSLISRGKLDDAEFLIQDLIKNRPDNGLYYAALANIRVSQGSYAEAIGLYKLALKTHPNHEIYLGLGRAYLLAKDYPSAIQAFEKAREIAPSTEEILLELCKAYLLGGRTERAKAIADELLARNPKSPDGHIASMLYLVRSNRKAEAAQHYRAFLQYGAGHPDYDKVKQNYAWLLRGGG